MGTRRELLQGAAAAAGVAFCGCWMLAPAASGRATAPKGLPVTVKGKRVKTVDAHAHCLIREALDLLGADQANKIIGVNKGAQEALITPEQRLKTMDAMGIDMEVLSINPFWYREQRDVAAEICRIQNDKLAQLCGTYPQRFAAFASLTLQHPDLAVQQLETAVRKQGLRGAAIAASVAGEEFSDTRFHPVWAKAEELGAVLFIHPQGTPELPSRLSGNGWLRNTIGNPLETTIALQHLIFEGTLDRYPRLKILSAHGGGYLPSYADRSDHACFVSPPDCSSQITLARKPSEYLRHLYFDSLIFTPEALRHLVAQVGSSQVVLGSDCPYPWEAHPVDHVFATNTLTDEEKAAILGGNAARLFGFA